MLSPAKQRRADTTLWHGTQERAGLRKTPRFLSQRFDLRGGNHLSRFFRQACAENRQGPSLQTVFLASRIGERVRLLAGCIEQTFPVMLRPASPAA